MTGVALTLEGHWEAHMTGHMRSIHHRVCIQEVPCVGEEEAEPCYEHNTFMVGAKWACAQIPIIQSLPDVLS